MERVRLFLFDLLRNRRRMPVFCESGRPALWRCTDIPYRRTPILGAIDVFKPTARLQFLSNEGIPMKISGPFFCTLAIAAAVTLLFAIPARAQSSLTGELAIQTTAADHAAAVAAPTRYRHAHPANNEAGQSLRALQTAEQLSSYSSTTDGRESGGFLQYFSDVTYGGGHVLTSAVSHAIYLQPLSGNQCTIAACWGDPEGFL